MSWKTRKYGSPNQIGKAFPLRKYPNLRTNQSFRIFYIVGERDNPLFLIDENLPRSVENVLRRDLGYKAIHITKLFRRGVSDEEIKNYAEDHHAIILTRDILSFPEPKKGGDRVAIEDIRGERTIDEIENRLYDLGYIKRKRIKPHESIYD